MYQFYTVKPFTNKRKRLNFQQQVNTQDMYAEEKLGKIGAKLETPTRKYLD